MRAFLRIDGIKGRCQETGHEGWISVWAFRYRVGEPDDPAGDARQGQGKADGWLEIEKPLSWITPQLEGLACTGKVLTRVELDVCVDTPDAAAERLLLITLHDATVASIRTEFPGRHGYATEVMRLRCRAMRWNAFDPTYEGIGSMQNATGWDFVSNSRL